MVFLCSLQKPRKRHYVASKLIRATTYAAENALSGLIAIGAMLAKTTAKAADTGAAAGKTSLKLKKAMICLLSM